MYEGVRDEKVCFRRVRGKGLLLIVRRESARERAYNAAPYDGSSVLAVLCERNPEYPVILKPRAIMRENSGTEDNRRISL